MNNDTDRPIQEKLSPGPEVFWRVEGSLLNLSAVRPVAFFTWNAHSFAERWLRRGGLGLLAIIRPLLFAIDRIFATRVLHALLRGISQDRLDLLGEEYFTYVLKPQLKPRGVAKLREIQGQHHNLVLVSQGLDHVMRPLAHYLGVTRLVANRLEFRDGIATGRLLHPTIRPRGLFARFTGQRADGRISAERLSRDLGFPVHSEVLRSAIIPAQRQVLHAERPIVLFDLRKTVEPLSVRRSLAGKNILLIGVTGFIGKVWLTGLLNDVPDVGRIFLLVRRNRSQTATQRFERIVAESPVFDALHERYGDQLSTFLCDRIEVVEGDVSRPGLALDSETHARLTRSIDLVVNSSGLTDFNPDLRDALATNVDAVVHLLDFVRDCDRAALLHLSTCYVVGARDGRVREALIENYTPAHVKDFDAEREWRALHTLIQNTLARSESSEITEELKQLALTKNGEPKPLSGHALENQIRKHRIRWLRSSLTEAGVRRAKELGWPNTYTFTKSLAESLIAKRGANLPVAIVRPSIVETSTHQPFTGWNEGVNTSAPLSYLLGTYFRQLPSNERKRLDLIPVDLVCRGMALIAAALVQRRHDRVYQLATSAANPCDMRRSIELTSLAHRKHYRAQEGLEHWLRSRFDSIPVSKERYQKFSAPGQKAVIRSLKRLVQPLPSLRSSLERKERNLDRVERLIELYEPFILHNEQMFEAENIERLSAALPPEEQEAFGFDARAIDWWEYWINIHIPALRKWCYPILEGRPIETRPRRTFQLPVRLKTSVAESKTG